MPVAGADVTAGRSLPELRTAADIGGGVHRLEALAGRRAAVLPQPGLLADPAGVRPLFKCMMPLQQVLAAALGRSSGSKPVQSAYQRLVAAVAGERVAEGMGPPARW